MTPLDSSPRRAGQVCILGSAEPGSAAYELAGAAGEMLARAGITVVSGCGSPATRVAAERALAAGEVANMSDAELARVMTAAVRLYAAKVDINGETPLPVEPEKLTPTDVVVTVTQLILAVGLNLWDLSMWVQRPQR